MNVQRYRIIELSARAVMSYAVLAGDRYEFHLDEEAVFRCQVPGADHEQDSNALFYQLLCLLQKGKARELHSETVDESLTDIIFYMNFQRVFETKGLREREITRQRKAKDMFRPEGITLDFSKGPHRYVAFERSGNMSRNSRLSFIREDFYEPLRKRIMMGLQIKSCQLSKLYAYNGLMLSSGTRIEGIHIEKNHRVIVIDNFKEIAKYVFVTTVNDRGSTVNPRKFYRKETMQDIPITCFDGEGLISKRYAQILDIAYCGQHIHSSFQIRMPYVKGMLHEVDFHDFFRKSNVQRLRDAWGNLHDVGSVDVILTVSQFKAFGWMQDCGKTWKDYWKAFQKYNHALYITNVSKEVSEGLTKLNYQFLATVSIQPEEFRPADLPMGWDHSPAEEERNWLTKQTEQQYYDLRCDPEARIRFFMEPLLKQGVSKTSKEYRMAQVLSKNPLFINEPVYTKQLETQAEKILKQYAIGDLLVAGDIRYLSGDLLDFLRRIVEDMQPYGPEPAISMRDLILATDDEKIFYAPGAAYASEGRCTLLRNPHIARNEEIQLMPSPEDALRQQYLAHLTDVVMVSAKMLAAERLGGADFDGDMVRVIADPILNTCVHRNYQNSDALTNGANLSILMIPSLASRKQSPEDWEARYETVKNTFSSRIGQICNAALDRSVLAYNEKIDRRKRRGYIADVEMLAILNGLEIDAAKTGVRPDLSEYLNHSVKRTPFLKYKYMVEAAEERRAWYEDTHQEKIEKYFASTDWDKMDSPIERLPLLARELKKQTKPIRKKHIPDSQLFAFAQEEGWQDRLKPATMEKIKALLADFEACLRRIRSCKAPVRNATRKSDIERILYRRGQDDAYDTDELYALFQTLPPEKLSDLRSAIREVQWHYLPIEKREAFLVQWLPGSEFEPWYDLLTDFRQYGFRVLADVVADIDDENQGTNRKLLHRQGDSEAFTAMMQAYVEHPKSKNYRNVVAQECREQLKRITFLGQAVRYVVALGKRELLWDILPDKILENVLEVKDDAQ